MCSNKLGLALNDVNKLIRTKELCNEASIKLKAYYTKLNVEKERTIKLLKSIRR